MTAERSSWVVGWTIFAAWMLMIQGVWWAIGGLVAIADDTFYTVTQDWIFKFDTTTWGWVHLILGVLVFISGIGLFSGNVWARGMGVVIAGLGGIIAFAWMPIIRFGDLVRGGLGVHYLGVDGAWRRHHPFLRFR